MPRYKRTRDEAELDVPSEPVVDPEHAETLSKLRNMWEFASLMQYIFMFGQVVKIDDDLDIEDLEHECLKPQPSEKLAHIGLALLKYVSSHRGLTPDIFDEYTRRQFVAKAPSRNPFGNNYEEDPAKFNEFDVFTKIRVLHQLSIWTFGNADRIRGLMPQDEDHLNWRVEPLGWDKDDRSYFVLDDNRLYRRSDEPVPEPAPTPKAKPKSKSLRKARSRGTRSSKRRKVEDTSDDEPEEAEPEVEEGAHDDTIMTNGEVPQAEEPGYGFTSKTWECVATTLEEYQEFLSSIFRTRDPNERQLRKRIEEDVLPIIEKRAEAIRQKQLKKMREFENLQKMATAKRSSRLADKAEKDREEREQREAEEKRQRDLKMAHEEEERQKRIEEGHESRHLTREQRLKEREVKRILNEEKLQELQEQEARASSQDVSNDTAEASKRMSERQMKTQKEQTQKELEKIKEEEGTWYFDCSKCGKHGENFDDGEHSVACDKCGTWQHSKCHGLSPKQAESEGFTFICNSCTKKDEDAKKPKIPPLKLGKSKSSASPETQKSAGKPASASRPKDSPLPAHVQRQLDGVHIPGNQPRVSPGPFGQITSGPSLSPHGQAQGPPGYRYPPVGNFAPNQPQQPWHGSPIPPPARPPSSGYASSPPPPMANGYGPSPHQQQHQFVHHNAVNASGGHPSYRPPPQYAPQPNGYSPRAPTGQYPMTQPTQQAPQPLPPAYHQHNQPPPPQQRGQLMNGFQSPVKAPAKPSDSPAAQLSPAHARQPQPSPSLQHSPRTTFPPPANTYQHNARSPIKSSPAPHQPAPHQPPPQTLQRPPQPSPSLAQTPQTFRPPSSNGYPPPNFQTPQMRPGSSHASNGGIAADGMSGPWPESSKVIPQKHDQSPAPPASSQTVGEKRIMPPVAALAPSPGQQQPEGIIPVKKMQEVNGAAVGTPSQAQQQPPTPQMQ